MQLAERRGDHKVRRGTCAQSSWHLYGGSGNARIAEPDTLVVRADFEEREGLLEHAPDTYYVTDYYRHYPVVLVRLSLLNRDVLRELLTRSWRMTVEKRRKSRTADDNAACGTTWRNRSSLTA